MARMVSVVMPPDASSFRGALRPGIEGHALAHGLERKIIQHGDIGAGVDGRLQLRQILDLDLHRDLAPRCASPRRPRAAIEPAAAMWFSLMRIPSNKPMR